MRSPTRHRLSDPRQIPLELPVDPPPPALSLKEQFGSEPEPRTQMTVQAERDALRWAIQMAISQAKNSEHEAALWKLAADEPHLSNIELARRMEEQDIRSDTGIHSEKDRLALVKLHSARKKDKKQSMA